MRPDVARRRERAEPGRVGVEHVAGERRVDGQAGEAEHLADDHDEGDQGHQPVADDERHRPAQARRLGRGLADARIARAPGGRRRAGSLRPRPTAPRPAGTRCPRPTGRWPRRRRSSRRTRAGTRRDCRARSRSSRRRGRRGRTRRTGWPCPGSCRGCPRTRLRTSRPPGRAARRRPAPRRRATGTHRDEVDADQRRPPVEPVDEPAERDPEHERRDEPGGERRPDRERRVRDLEREPADRDETDRHRRRPTRRRSARAPDSPAPGTRPASARSRARPATEPAGRPGCRAERSVGLADLVRAQPPDGDRQGDDADDDREMTAVVPGRLVPTDARPPPAIASAMPERVLADAERSGSRRTGRPGRPPRRGRRSSPIASARAGHQAQGQEDDHVQRWPRPPRRRRSRQAARARPGSPPRMSAATNAAGAVTSDREPGRDDDLGDHDPPARRSAWPGDRRRSRRRARSRAPTSRTRGRRAARSSTTTSRSTTVAVDRVEVRSSRPDEPDEQREQDRQRAEQATSDHPPAAGAATGTVEPGDDAGSSPHQVAEDALERPRRSGGPRGATAPASRAIPASARVNAAKSEVRTASRPSVSSTP